MNGGAITTQATAFRQDGFLISHLYRSAYRTIGYDASYQLSLFVKLFGLGPMGDPDSPGPAHHQARLLVRQHAAKLEVFASFNVSISNEVDNHR
jgi:hypothetical protein